MITNYIFQQTLYNLNFIDICNTSKVIKENVICIITWNAVYNNEIPCNYWKQNYSASAVARKICEVEGEDVVTSHIAQRWFQKFKNGENELQDQPRSKRPATLNSPMLRKSVKNNP